MIPRILSFLISLMVVASVQASIPMETWRTHLSYESVSQVELTPNKIFAVADHHLYSVSKEDRVVETYTKIDGLSENEVQLIAYHPNQQSLIIVYTNANIDIVTADGDVYNIPDVYKKNWTVDKTVYQIFCESDKAYLAMGFGVVAVNLKKREIMDTYIIGPDATKIPVYGFSADDTFFYALTAQQILKAPKQGKNLLDYANWREDTLAVPDSSQCKTLFCVNSSLLTVYQQNVVLQYQDGWKPIFTGTPGMTSVTFNGSQAVFAGGEAGVNLYNSAFQLQEQYPIFSVMSVYDPATYLLWSGHPTDGVFTMDSQGKPLTYQPHSIAFQLIHQLKFDQNQLWATPGGYWLDRFCKPIQLSKFQDESWTSYDQFAQEVSQFADISYDATAVAVDPAESTHFFFSTYGEGVFEVKENQIVELYNHLNTQGALQTIIPNNPHYIRIDEIQFDNKANLWILNSMSGVKVFTNGGEWISMNYPPLSTLPTIRNLVLAKHYKWFVSLRDPAGVFVFNDAGTLNDVSDDKYRFFQTGFFHDKDGKVLSPSYCYDIAEDKDGIIWVGTDWGPLLFTDTKKVFDDNYRCTRVKLPREDGSGLADYLLSGIPVLSIEVDAGNRKWIGTQGSGVYLFSPDGKTTLKHFDSKNSPLSSNNVNSIAIHPKTGEVFMATDEGLFSYRSDATEPVEEATSSTITVFPNPVRPEFGGPITVTGLEDHSHVWITDAAGGVVFQGRSNGGTCVWDGKNYSGRPVSGGVYFVLVSNANSENHRSVATKLLIVR